MATEIELPEEVAAQLAQVGAADLALGLVTAGPSPALAGVASAIRGALDGRLSAPSSVLIHVDRAATPEATAQLAQGLRDVPVVRVAHPPVLDGGDGALEWGDAVHTVLRAGQRVEARAILMLSAEAPGSPPEWPGALAEPVVKEGAGLVLGVHRRSRYDGTLTQSLVTPFVQGVFGRRFRQPVADEFACSGAAAAQLLADDVWSTDAGRQSLPFWMPILAIERDLPVGQVGLGQRGAPVTAPRPAPLGPTVGRVAGALFSLAERFESAWIDRRASEPVRAFGPLPEPTPGAAVDPERMLLGFRQGVRDLLPIWERILAPETLGDVLAVSEAEAGGRGLDDRLWTHVVYDFLLAYRAGVMYRPHLVQSLAPLYLGRVAALVLETRARPAPAVVEVMERLGRAFEDEKPYLLDRWR